VKNKVGENDQLNSFVDQFKPKGKEQAESKEKAPKKTKKEEENDEEDKD
jgi:hypothetical protein